MARQYVQQKKQTKVEMFDALVRNAVDFVDSSLDNLNTRPKNGIVDIYTAIELFLKARLMAEHWALVISKPESASLTSFQEGDFHSVYLEDAAKRLENIAGVAVDAQAMRVFKALGEHRNQIVHFAHTDYVDAGSAKAGVLLEQWTAWRHLHTLLTEKWPDVFLDYLGEFQRLHERMHAEAKFIPHRFEELKTKIHGLQNAGVVFVTCAGCGTSAGQVTKSHPWGADYTCLVCNHVDCDVTPTDATLKCPKCNSDFKFFGKGRNVCEHCKSPITTEQAIALCNEIYTTGDEWAGEEDHHIAYCHTCRFHKPSVFYIEGLWSCASCFDRGWRAMQCDNCSSFVTGDVERIKYFACCMCEDVVSKSLDEGLRPS